MFADPRMLDPDEDQQAAMRDIQPLLPGIHAVFRDAFALYQGPDYSDRVRAEHNDRAAANNMYAHVEKKAIEVFDGIPGVAFINVNSLHVLNYKDLALLRFKKVRANGRHSNVQTDQQRDYDDQLSIPGLPDRARRLTAGYQLDAAGTSIERVIISRPIGRTILWAAQVLADESRAEWEDITTKRFAGTSPVDFDAERVRLRRAR